VECNGASARDGVAEAQSKQGIAIGRDCKSDELLIYCPHSKKYFISNSYKIDEGRSTANAFKLKYDAEYSLHPLEWNPTLKAQVY
jgi:hypothetical protein